MDDVTTSAEFDAYVDRLAAAIGHADRREPLRAYCAGLLIPGRRKSVEPMAARVEPLRVSARHQSMHHFVANADWDDGAVMRTVRSYVLPRLEVHGSIAAWLLDDTGIRKKGRHSVGVANQYCGEIGKNDNCQVAVSLSAASAEGSLPLGYRLYLPEVWASDLSRREKCGVPEAVSFAPKWQIGLELIDAALADREVARAPVVADAAFGNVFEFRQELTSRRLRYVVGVLKSISVWPPGQRPLEPPAYSGRGRPPKRVRRSEEHQPVSAYELGQALPEQVWQEVTWREGSAGEMKGRFAAVRVHPAHRDNLRVEPHPLEWLLIEWPEDAAEPSHYWLSTEPSTMSMVSLVQLAKLRWRIERDYQELKQEIGLDHYEGRGWRGFHHHATLCVAAYGFLMAERARLSPPEPLQSPAVQVAPLPGGFRKRGASSPG